MSELEELQEELSLWSLVAHDSGAAADLLYRRLAIELRRQIELLAPQPIAPVPTSYAGVLFRSRLEARWAVFFEDLEPGCWEWEPEAYRLPDGRKYVPDFLLRGAQLAEVKRKGASFEKARALGVPVWQLIDWPPGIAPRGVDPYRRWARWAQRSVADVRVAVARARSARFGAHEGKS